MTRDPPDAEVGEPVFLSGSVEGSNKHVSNHMAQQGTKCHRCTDGCLVVHSHVN